MIHGSSGLRPSDLWLGSGHPQGVPCQCLFFDTRALQNAPLPSALLTKTIPLSQWVMDPARDPGFLATGRAAIAAKTCGQIDVLTTTPCGSPGKGVAARRPTRGRGGRGGVLHIGHRFADDRCLWSKHPQWVPSIAFFFDRRAMKVAPLRGALPAPPFPRLLIDP